MVSVSWGGSNGEHLIHEMKSMRKKSPQAVQINLDEVVLKHIPLETPANVALQICKTNGFKTTVSTDMRGADLPGFDEFIYCSLEKRRWYLIASDEYRAVLYIKNGRVGAGIGRYFFHTI